MVKFNFQGGKNQFPGSAARQASFTAIANQSNESVTLVKMNFYRGKSQFPRWLKINLFPPCDTRTLPCRLRVHRWKLIFTTVEIDFYHVGKFLKF